MNALLARVDEITKEHIREQNRRLELRQNELTRGEAALAMKQHTMEVREACVQERERAVTEREKAIAQAGSAASPPPPPPPMPAATLPRNRLLCSHCGLRPCGRSGVCIGADGSELHPGHHNCSTCHMNWKNTGSKGGAGGKGRKA